VAGNSLADLIRADQEIAVLYAKCAAKHAAVVEAYDAALTEVEAFNKP